jgi:hypothetical protein
MRGPLINPSSVRLLKSENVAADVPDGCEAAYKGILVRSRRIEMMQAAISD